MHERVTSCLSIARRCAEGQLSPQVALMQMLIASEDVELVERALAALEPGQAAVQATLACLLDDNRAGCLQIVAQLRCEPTHSAALSSEASLAFHRELFDQLVRSSEESSVALYSLGNPDILAAATDEIVHFLGARGLLTADTRVLDMGCGIGRLELALSAHVSHVVGIDLSPQMVLAARRRCAHLENVRCVLGTGRDLADSTSRSFELLLAVDSFPYVVLAGDMLVDALFDEARRVLVPGGRFVLFNFSYRDDLARDREQVGALARRHGFTVEVAGERPFALWDGAVFLLRAAHSLHGAR